jgi:hypothetical protein
MPAKPPEQPQSFDNAKLYLWIKGLEGKVNNLLREVDVLKNDFINKSHDMKKELKNFNSDLVEMKHEQEKSGQKMDLIIKELRMTAGKEEMMTMKKYLDLWNPLNFVTQRDVERLVEEKINPPENPHLDVRKTTQGKKTLPFH